MSAVENFTEPRCMKLVLPVDEGRSMIINCFGKNLSPELMEVELIQAKLSAENLDFDRECRLSYLEGEKVVTIPGRVKAFLNEERLQIAIGGAHSRQHKRNDLRVNTRVYLKYGLANDKDSHFAHIPDALVNLSASGICFASTERFEMADQVALEILLPRLDATAGCLGTVRRVSAFGTGCWLIAVEFEGLELADRLRMEKYCASLLVEQIQNLESSLPYDQLLLQELAIA